MIGASEVFTNLIDLVMASIPSNTLYERTAFKPVALSIAVMSNVMESASNPNVAGRPSNFFLPL